MADRAGAAPASELARLIRRSPVLDPALKRQWLRVLPHLTPADRARLQQILDAAPRTPPPDGP